MDVQALGFRSHELAKTRILHQLPQTPCHKVTLVSEADRVASLAACTSPKASYALGPFSIIFLSEHMMYFNTS